MHRCTCMSRIASPAETRGPGATSSTPRLRRHQRTRQRSSDRTAPLGPMLDHQQAQKRQVVDLPDLDAHHPGVDQLAAAAPAALGGVHHDHVRMLDLGQVRARSAGLAAGLAAGAGLGGAAARPVGPGWALGQPVSRRRPGGVGGVGPQPGLKLHDVRVELADARLQGRDHRVPGDDLGPQPGDGGRRIVQHAAAGRVAALLVRRARPGRRRLAPLQAAGQPAMCAQRRSARTTTTSAAASCGRRPPTTMWLHALPVRRCSPGIVELTAARGRSTTNQIARAGAATG